MFVLPELKKPYSTYEPYIDEQTMEIHHKLHHGGYIKKLNAALIEADVMTERIEDIFENMSHYSSKVHNNAGGHYNHSMFWSILDTRMTTPSTELADAISKKFGLMADFKKEFTEKSLALFGSGWCWLVINSQNELDIVTTSNQDNPLMNNINMGYPLICLDLWEHAYYLKNQNKRDEYIVNFWSLLDWNIISQRFEQKPEMLEII